MQEAEKILQIERDISWLPLPNVGTIVLSAKLPPEELIITSLVLAFAGDRFLQTHLVKRGWDVPGGHVEPGESPEETARREVYEETGARLGPLHLLGNQHLHLLCPRPASYQASYPDSYQVFYWAHVTSLDTLIPTAETRGAALFAPADAQALPWVQAHRELYLAALSAATSKSGDRR